MCGEQRVRLFKYHFPLKAGFKDYNYRSITRQPAIGWEYGLPIFGVRVGPMEDYRKRQVQIRHACVQSPISAHLSSRVMG